MLAEGIVDIHTQAENVSSDRTRLWLVGFISIFRTEITKLIVELNENKEAKQSFFRKAEMPEEDQSHGEPWWNVFGYRRWEEILTLERLLLQALVISISVEVLKKLLVFFDILGKFYQKTC